MSPARPEPTELGAGALLAGQARYRVEAEIGRGGFGRIYRATRLDDGASVAIKLLVLPWAEERGGEQRRFEQEAALVRRLDHPNVVRLYDFGRVGGGQPFMVCELLEGRSLREAMAAEGPLPVVRVARLGAQVLGALRAAHGLGIVHRDVKPDNIVLVGAGDAERACVIDFGIAKVLWGEGAEVTKLTATGYVVGSPHYMAPEQARGQGVGPAVDLYALGLSLAEALTGRRVVAPETPMDALLVQIDPAPLPLDDAVLRTPLGPIVARAVQKPVELRYHSAAEMLAALQPLLDSRGAGAPPGSVPAVGRSSETRSPVDPFGPTKLAPVPVAATAPGLPRASAPSQPGPSPTWSVAPAAVAPTPAPGLAPAWPAADRPRMPATARGLTRERLGWILLGVLGLLLVAAMGAIAVAWQQLRARTRPGAQQSPVGRTAADPGDDDGARAEADGPEVDRAIDRLTEQQLRQRLAADGWKIEEQGSSSRDTPALSMLFLLARRGERDVAQVQLLRYASRAMADQAFAIYARDRRFAARRGQRTVLYVVVATNPPESERVMAVLMGERAPEPPPEPPPAAPRERPPRARERPSRGSRL